MTHISWIFMDDNRYEAHLTAIFIGHGPRMETCAKRFAASEATATQATAETEGARSCGWRFKQKYLCPDVFRFQVA
jgi:hypothetical protein